MFSCQSSRSFWSLTYSDWRFKRLEIICRLFLTRWCISLSNNSFSWSDDFILVSAFLISAISLPIQTIPIILESSLLITDFDRRTGIISPLLDFRYVSILFAELFLKRASLNVSYWLMSLKRILTGVVISSFSLYPRRSRVAWLTVII